MSLRLITSQMQMRNQAIQQKQHQNTHHKPNGCRQKCQTPIASHIFIDGIKSDQTDAATITPDANPKSVFWMIGFNSFFKKKTQAAPAVVPTNGIKTPSSVL